MRRLLRFLFVVWPLCCMTIASSTTCADESIDAKAIVDAIGRRAVETEGVVGLSIGVAKDDTILCTQGFGLANAELNVPATPDTVYRIGSITKEFTAAAVLLLVQDGKINLDDALTEHLPGYPPHASKVTIRQLLHHTSGIKDFTRLPAYRKELPVNVSQEDVRNRFQHLPLDFQPGQQHRYNNSGFFLLGLVVEQASGESFQGFVDERLLKALELDHTYCDAPDRIIPHRAAGYTRWSGVFRNARYINIKQTVGAGNIASTVGDLLRWQRALVDDSLLTPESADSMMGKGKLNDGTPFNYGLGVFVRKVDGRDVVRHGGGISGFRSDLVYYPASGYTIAVLANSENANAPRISDRIARRLFDGDK